MGNAGRIHHAFLIAAFVLIGSPASAQAKREPILASLPGSQTKAINDIAAACMSKGWKVENRTDHAVDCVNVDASPQSKASFAFAERDGRALVQITTRQVVYGGRDPVFGPSRTMAGDAVKLVVDLGGKAE